MNLPERIFNTFLLATSLTLVGCGGSDNPPPDNSGDTLPSTSTSFKFSVALPDNLAARAAKAGEDPVYAARIDPASLQASDIDVAIVNAAGEVVEIINPVSFSTEPDGSYILVLPGGTRVDCVILVDVDGTATLTLNQPLPSNTLFAPTTTTNPINIDVRSTAAYQEFIESIPDTVNLQTDDSVTTEELERIIQQVQAIQPPAVSPGQTLEQYLAGVITGLADIVATQVDLASNSIDSTFNLADYLITDNSAVYEFFGDVSSADDFFFEYLEISGANGERDFTYNPATSQFTLDSNQVNDNFYLSSDGRWLTEDAFVLSADADGSVQINFSASDGDIQRNDNLISIDVVSRSNLAGKGLDDVLDANDNGYSPAISDSAVFSAGAELFYIAITQLTDNYYLNSFFNESTNAIDYDRVFTATGSVANSLANITVATAANTSDVNNMNLVLIGISASAEFVYGEFVDGGLLNLFSLDFTTATLLQTASWSMQTNNGVPMIVIDYTPALRSLLGEFSLDDQGVFFVEFETSTGVTEVILGTKSTAGSSFTLPFYNAQAKTDILDNFDVNNIPRLEFTQGEVSGSTHYQVYPNDEITSCGIGTWIVENVVYTDTTYTLTFCDGTTEVGSYAIVDGDIQWNPPQGGTDFTRRISLDNGFGGWIACTTELQFELDSCDINTVEQYDVFTSQATAQTFADQQNAATPQQVTLSGAWGSGSGPGMFVFYPSGFYMNYATDAQDCPNGGVEYGSYSYDGNEMTVTPDTDENGTCGFSVNGAVETYTVGISNDGNQLDITSFDPDTQANETFSLPRVTDGNPNSIVGGWDIGGSLTTPQALVFYPNGTYIHWQETGSDQACTPGGVEYGSYSFDGSSISGSIDRDENNDCGLGAGPGGLTFPSTTVVNNVLTFNNGELFVFDRLETSNSATGSFSINMTGKTATSVIIYSECPSDPLGWTYTFTSSSMTLTGADGWQTPACTTRAEETFSLDMTTLASDFDIPFNCAGYPVCTASDFYQSFSGIDQDNRSFTAVYSFNRTTNELTYNTSVEGATITETITIQ